MRGLLTQSGQMRHGRQEQLALAVITLLLALSGCGTHASTTFTSGPPAQNLKPLTNQPPDGAGIGFLLTDGSVIFQGNKSFDWFKLTSDQSGSYANGTWSQIASLPAGYIPREFASSVLANGRLVILGGEYNNGIFVLTNLGAIYDPVANGWTSLAAPAGWNYIGDSPSVVLPDGQFLVGRKIDMLMATLDPISLQWTARASTGKSDFDAEEGWTLLPDGSVLTFDVKNAPNSERYIPSLAMWVTAGSTIVDLHSSSTSGCLAYGGGCYLPPGEVGPAVLGPDGTVFATGSKSIAGPGHTAIYTPPTVLTDPGTWVPGPDFPSNDNAGDSFAVLLTNGHVLVEGNSGRLYEFDGKTLTANASVKPGSSLLVLPTGEVIVGGDVVQLYTSSGKPSAAWAPTITTFPASVARGSTYSISGTQFNGLSQAAAFGDEEETATNYPLVRITNQATGHIFYARTHDHSTMAVATGSTVVSTNFDVPTVMETGPSSLEVVANGIASASVSITVN
ncbi:MAG TPA: hypothetical protein VNX26_00295 [Candidatus Acidoferrum sp.]|nr:hypothetical protein [Candidatus Acidoferrum sp.]